MSAAFARLITRHDLSRQASGEQLGYSDADKRTDYVAEDATHDARRNQRAPTLRDRNRSGRCRADEACARRDDGFGEIHLY